MLCLSKVVNTNTKVIYLLHGYDILFMVINIISWLWYIWSDRVPGYSQRFAVVVFFVQVLKDGNTLGTTRNTNTSLCHPRKYRETRTNTCVLRAACHRWWMTRKTAGKELYIFLVISKVKGRALQGIVKRRLLLIYIYLPTFLRNLQISKYC